MKRFFGMMPSDCIKKEDIFRDRDGLKVRIQAGEEGWSIIWADGGSDFKYVQGTTDDNFKEAYTKAVECVGDLIKSSVDKSYNVES